MMLFYLIAILKFIYVTSDIYLHNPRGCNNRLDEAGRARNNANRLFDSENNNRGGYNVGSLYYYTGSILPIEWTNQHSCAEKNSHCEIIIQYMCDDWLRDGTTTNTIPSKRSRCAANDCNKDVRYGMHENYDYYMNCRLRKRNLGLFTVNRINTKRATGTRQNPNQGQYGYECLEEKDYYPYWHPSPWKDIAVMTNDVSRCKMYREESQNVKSRHSCVPPAKYMDDMINSRNPMLLPINKEECEAMVYPRGSNNTFKWVETKPFNQPPPSCVLGPKNRDNHLGNTLNGFPNMFNWTIPDTLHEHCALRIRYNISTSDYEPWSTNITSKIDIGKLVGISDEEEAKARGYILKDNPIVQPIRRVKNGDDIGKKLKLELAINTAQFGRTFEDRSHSFAIRKRSEQLKKTKIHNVNVRGKRGNIVQVYPAVEYDFVPNRLFASTGDNVHFQWTGSNTNPRNNDGQGLAGTDRSNIAVLTGQNYPEGTPGKAVPNGLKYGHWGNNYPSHLDNVTFLGLSRTDMEHLALLRPGQYGGELSELDDAGTYFDLGPKKITSAGTYHYMSTRNNNFSNRSQKGKIVVTTVKSAEKGIGWSGGEVVLDEGDQGVWIKEGVVAAQKLIRVEEWSEEDGKKLVESKGGYIKVGENYESNFLAVYPFSELVDGADVTMKIRVSSDDVVVYHSLDFVHWRKVNNVAVKGGIAKYEAQKGGVYVARKSGGQPTTLIALIVVMIIVLILVVGSVLYCRKRPAMSNVQQRLRNNLANQL